jgi:uncharacterized protein YkwD
VVAASFLVGLLATAGVSMLLASRAQPKPEPVASTNEPRPSDPGPEEVPAKPQPSSQPEVQAKPEVAITTLRTMPKEVENPPAVVVVPPEKPPVKPVEVPVKPKEKEVPIIVNKSRLDRAINRLNEARAAVKAPELVYDPWACERATEHAQALITRSDSPALDDKKPGNAIAWKAPLSAVLEWLEKPLHRDLLLLPARKELGIGTATDESGRSVTVIEGLFEGQIALGTATAWMYPAAGQTEVPLQFSGNEVPDPLPDVDQKQVGYPITVQFAPGSVVRQAQMLVEGPDGRPERLHLSSPESPANKEHARLQQNTICAFVTQPLRPGSRYVVRVRAMVDGKPWARLWAFMTQPTPGGTEKHLDAALEHINMFRKAAGLNPVQRDAPLSQACESHARYVLRHRGRVPQLDVQNQDESLEGYTPEGARIARQSFIRLDSSSRPTDAVDWLLDSVMNRNLLLNPTMKEVGIAAAGSGSRGWIWVLHFPSQRERGEGQPVAYPGNDQTAVPLYFPRKVRDLVPEAPADQIAGYPVTLTYYPAIKITGVSATLQTAKGAEVPTWVSTPEKRLNGTGRYNQIVLLPRQPLTPKTTYRVRIAATVDDKPTTQEWTFTTVDPALEEQAVAEHLLAEINRHRQFVGLGKVTLDETLSQGCQLHADYLVRNLSNPSAAGLNIHDEDKSLPGYTEAGRRAGEASVIAVLGEPRESVAMWMATLYHRLPLLTPGVKRIGYGQRQHPTRGWITVLDCTSGK